MKRQKATDDLVSMMMVVETAFEWVSAQRVVNFEIPVWESEVDLFMALNYFMINPIEDPMPEDSQDPMTEELFMAHKRSPQFMRDLIRPLPEFNMRGYEEIKEVKII